MINVFILLLHHIINNQTYLLGYYIIITIIHKPIN